MVLVILVGFVVLICVFISPFSVRCTFLGYLLFYVYFWLPHLNCFHLCPGPTSVAFPNQTHVFLNHASPASSVCVSFSVCHFVNDQIFNKNSYVVFILNIFWQYWALNSDLWEANIAWSGPVLLTPMTCTRIHFFKHAFSVEQKKREKCTLTKATHWKPISFRMMYSTNYKGQNSLHMYGQLGLNLAQIASCNDEWT